MKFINAASLRLFGVILLWVGLFQVACHQNSQRSQLSSSWSSQDHHLIGRMIASISLIPIERLKTPAHPDDAEIFPEDPAASDSSPPSPPESTVDPTPPHDQDTVGLNLIKENEPWTTPSPLIEWVPDPQAAMYHVQIDDSEQCTSPILEQTLTPLQHKAAPPTRIKVSSYLENGLYWVCIQSFNENGVLLGKVNSATEIRALGYGDPEIYNGHTTRRGYSPHIGQLYPEVNFLFSHQSIWKDQPTRQNLGFGKHFSIWSDPNDEFILKMFVVDSKWNRILIFDHLPSKNNAEPDLVIGQMDFESFDESNKVSPLSLKEPSFVSVCQDGRLLVTDQGNNRILIWNAVPQDFNVPADFVIGQDDMSTNLPGQGVKHLRKPSAAFCTPKGIIVADAGNNRLLVYDAKNYSKPKIVLGQKNFNSQEKSCHQGGLSLIEDLWIDGSRLVLTDTLNNRVLVYHQFPSKNGELASHVIGQKNFETCLPNQGEQADKITTDTLFEPSALRFYKNTLLVSDRKNKRILIFPWDRSNIPTEATDVIGAKNFGPSTGQHYYLAPATHSSGNLEVGGMSEPFHGIYVMDHGIWTLGQKSQQLVRLPAPADW